MMDFPVASTNNGLTSSADKYKKNIQLKALLSTPRTDKRDLKKFLLENFIIIPQEDRLSVWKCLLDIPLKSNDLESHYLYLKRIIKDILGVKVRDEVYLNYHIYLLDNGQLPLSEVKCNNKVPFYVLYNQIVEVIDDANESDYYYLTVRLYEYLFNNISKMKLILHEYFLCKETVTDKAPGLIKSIIEHESIKYYFLTAFAFKFHSLFNYIILLDHLVFDSCEILIYILIIFIERIRDNHQSISLLDSKDYYIDEQLGLDESRIKKGIEKLSKLFQTNSATLLKQ